MQRGIEINVTDNIEKTYNWEPGQQGVFECSGSAYDSGVFTLYSVSKTGHEQVIGAHSAADGRFQFSTAADRVRLKVTAVAGAAADVDVMLAPLR